MSNEIIKISEGVKALTERLDAIRDENMTSFMAAAQASYSGAKSNFDAKMDEVAASEAAAETQYQADMTSAREEMQTRYDFLVANVNQSAVDSYAEVKTLHNDFNLTTSNEFQSFSTKAANELVALENEIGVVEDIETLLESLVPGYSGAA